MAPVFLPFAGCPGRCVYCAQHLQTARGLPRVDQVLAGAGAMLAQRAERGLPPAELAFYGGTFTAQREEDFALCLEAARSWAACGLISSWRCSTRPDSLGGGRLERAREAGCACVELGVQSFDDGVLAAAGRGCTGEDGARAVERVRASGAACGVQLLPGLPLSTPDGFRRDVARSLELGAGFMRFYPCLVVRSTRLAQWYAEGRYEPWPLDVTVEALAAGLVMASLANVPVTRLGVAVEPSFEPHVLAGPRDPDLGTRVRSRALWLAARDRLPRGARVARAVNQRQVQGGLNGHRGDMKAAWAELGVHPGNVSWHAVPRIDLETACSETSTAS